MPARIEEIERVVGPGKEAVDADSAEDREVYGAPPERR